MINNIRSFLYDQDYFINIFDNKIYIFNYLDLNHFSDTLVSLKMENFKLDINGDNLTIVKMESKEIMINGTIKGVKIVR